MAFRRVVEFPPTQTTPNPAKVGGAYVTGESQVIEAKQTNKTEQAGRHIVKCRGHRNGKACSAQGLPEYMMAPSVEDMRRIYHGNPRLENVSDEARCRACEAVEKKSGRVFRYFRFSDVLVRVADAEQVYDAEVFKSGRFGDLFEKMNAPRPGSKAPSPARCTA